MNFTEISELNEILSHCRSFHPVSSYSLNTSPFEHHQNTQKDLNFISVDELISSSFIDITPINSRINYEKMSYGDDNDNIEKIIADINKFLYIDGKEISRRRSNDRSKEGILISASLQELNNVRMDFSAPKQAFRYKRSVTFEVEDDDNPFSPKKGKNTGETKKVSIDMLINECEKKDESDKSEKTKDFDTQNKQITLPNVVRCVKKLQTENITRNFTRKNTITFLSESVKQNFFYKLDESFFINIFLKKIRSKSLLSENLSNKVILLTNFSIEYYLVRSCFKLFD